VKYRVVQTDNRDECKAYDLFGEDGKHIYWVEWLGSRPNTRVAIVSDKVFDWITIGCVLPLDIHNPQKSIDRIKILAVLE
jgi:hypothetical protein